MLDFLHSDPGRLLHEPTFSVCKIKISMQGVIKSGLFASLMIPGFVSYKSRSPDAVASMTLYIYTFIKTTF